MEAVSESSVHVVIRWPHSQTQGAKGRGGILQAGRWGLLKGTCSRRGGQRRRLGGGHQLERGLTSSQCSEILRRVIESTPRGLCAHPPAPTPSRQPPSEKDARGRMGARGSALGCFLQSRCPLPQGPAMPLTRWDPSGKPFYPLRPHIAFL